MPEGVAGLVLVGGFLAMLLLVDVQHALGGRCGAPGHSHGHSHGHAHGHSHAHGASCSGGDNASGKDKAGKGKGPGAGLGGGKEGGGEHQRQPDAAPARDSGGDDDDQAPPPPPPDAGASTTRPRRATVSRVFAWQEKVYSRAELFAAQEAVRAAAAAAGGSGSGNGGGNGRRRAPAGRAEYFGSQGHHGAEKLLVREFGWLAGWVGRPRGCRDETVEMCLLQAC